MDGEVYIQIKWNNQIIPIEISCSQTVGDLKVALCERTDVLPHRQKLIGLKVKKGQELKTPNHANGQGTPSASGAASPFTGSVDDSILIDQLQLKAEQKIMMVGSIEDDIQKVEQFRVMSDEMTLNVVNDLDIDYSVSSMGGTAEGGRAVAVTHVEAARKKLERRIAEIEIRIINPLRDGKKLLVLDLDYTLFDCKGTASVVAELGRPGLHEFLTAVYPYYDIVVWSQTSWRWLEAKITELGMLLNPRYKLAFVLDRTSMFSITSDSGNGIQSTHEVKALEIIWRKFPGRYDASNTVHIDDLSRNFALNPQSGLKISAFKNAHIS